ncbi:WD repeat-containing protein 63, partial [Nowakowskiella sp. JEL0078]
MEAPEVTKETTQDSPLVQTTTTGQSNESLEISTIKHSATISQSNLQKSNPSLKSNANNLNEPATIVNAEIKPQANFDDIIDDIVPLFLTGITQDIVKARVGEEVKSDMPFVVVKKADLVADLSTRLVISDFFPAKALIM